MLVKWEEEFDRLIDEKKCLPKETLLKTCEHFKNPQELDFYNYPESPYELDPEKVKEFIRRLKNACEPGSQ